MERDVCVGYKLYEQWHDGGKDSELGHRLAGGHQSMGSMTA